MEILGIILALVGAEIIASFIKRLLFKPKAKNAPVVVKEKMVPPVLIIRIPETDDEDIKAETMAQMTKNFSYLPYQVIFVYDERVKHIQFEHPLNYYCDSMKPVNDN